MANFSFSEEIPCDKDSSKTCFSGAANSPKQLLFILAIMSLIPGLLLDLRKKNASFSSFIERVCFGNLVFMESI